MESSDKVLRAITDDGAFRVITACTTSTTREVVRLQKVTGRTAEHLADLVTGTILLRETMSPQLRVQGILRDIKSGSSLVGDAHPDGTSRGLAKGTAELNDGALLQMMRTLPSGRLHQGTVQLTGARGISDGLMEYMQVSEQVRSALAVGTMLRDGVVVASGGYMVQLLPELSEDMLAIMTARLDDFPPIHRLLAEASMTPERLLDELLYGMPYAMLDKSDLSFGCNCSQLRVVAGIATLGRAEIRELAHAGEVLEIACDFCTKDYQVSPEQLRGLLEES